MTTGTVFVLSLVALTTAMPKGHEHHKHEYGLVGGDSADIKDYPYTASIFSDYLQSLAGTGVVLNKYWILCSAYEVMGYDQYMTTVRVGSSDAVKGGQYVNASGIWRREDFVMDYGNDIALIKTADPLKLSKTVKAAKLPDASPEAGTEGQVTGFGKTEDGSTNGLLLKQAKVKVLSKDDCVKAHPTLGDSSFCADADGVGPCESDLGSPLVKDSVVLGLYVGGDTCNRYGVPEIYTDVAIYKQWIKDKIKQYSNTPEEMEGFADDDQ